jgi:hypothetical protein
MPSVLVVVTDRVEGGVAVVAATEEVRRLVAVGSENSAFRASEVMLMVEAFPRPRRRAKLPHR